jgi:hypothetical protein
VSSFPQPSVGHRDSHQGAGNIRNVGAGYLASGGHRLPFNAPAAQYYVVPDKQELDKWDGQWNLEA